MEKRAGTKLSDIEPRADVHPSRAVRITLVILGTVFVAVGIVGVFLPVLPTTPLMLLAAACYARASARFYDALLGSRAFGPTIREWREHRSIPSRTKWTSIGLMALTFTASIAFAVDHPHAKVGLAALGIGLAVWIARIPSRIR